MKGYQLVVLLLLGVNLVAAGQEVSVPYGTIMGRINADLQSGSSDAKVRSAIAALKEDGRWPDINYANPDYDPLQRIKGIAIAYSGANHQLYGDAKAYAAVVKAMQHWLELNPKNKNWWYNDIFYPKMIGEILILMRYGKMPLPAGLEQPLIARMIRKLKTGDGANTSDEALHYLYRACLTQHKSTLDSASTYLFEPVSITDGKEGVQVDNSYFQHGKQQAIGSYGAVFASNSVNAAFYLRGTPYAMPAGQLNILMTYLKDTFFKTIRGSFFDFNVRGRGISRRDSLKGVFGGLITKIKALNPENTAYWDAAAKRMAMAVPASYGIIPGNRVYWKSGYTLHIRPAYTFSVQTASSRTWRTERGNNENILGKFLADGATNIQVRGDEYANVMPVWEWDKIPGTTSRDYSNDGGATIKQDWGIPGTTAFVGGVSNGLYGLSVYAQDIDGVQAKKAWFFFDKEVVCLGAGIRSDAAEEVKTTLNQSWLKGEVVLDKAHAAPEWGWHDHIGYFLPDGGAFIESDQLQKGNWYRINQSQSKEEISGKVFQLSLSHGVKPSDGHYEYIVVPGLKDAKMMRNYNLSMLRILSNTADLQVVEHKGLDLLQLVFYKGGVFSGGDFSVKADKACTILIEGLHTENPIINVADPAQENTAIQLEVKLPGLKDVKKLNCVLPAGAQKGATASCRLNSGHN